MIGIRIINVQTHCQCEQIFAHFGQIGKILNLFGQIYFANGLNR